MTGFQDSTQNRDGCMKKILLKSTIMLIVIVLAQAGVVFASEGNHIDSGATAWMLTSTALVLLMVPGLAMFYGGLVRTKAPSLRP